VSYHGYIPLVKKFLYELDRAPAILEIGVDRGVTFLTMMSFLARCKRDFFAIGIDVMIQEQVKLMLNYTDLQQSQQVYLIEQNSLTALPKMVEQGFKFDVLFLDGDHNYYTVSNELKHVNSLMNKGGIIIIDDYDGRWESKDLWYADRAGYETNSEVTQKQETEKHGVKPAVDEWLENNQQWKKSKPIPGEPIILTCDT
jgi:predicted O-methyltransferase YrrM